MARGWGGVARRGAGRIRDDAAGGASAAFREAGRPAAERPTGGARPRETVEEEWIVEVVDDDGLAATAEAAVRRAGRGRSLGTGGGDAADLEDAVRTELAAAVGARRVPRFEERLRDATRAFGAERFRDAGRMLRKLADEAPGAPSVRELYGLALYRQGRWRDAARELEAFRLLTDSTEQHPVLADCYRALGEHRRVAELWEELRQASPGADLVTEGRIVAAGDLADQGELTAAIALLERGFSLPKRPRPHHLRRAYALADCYERAGEVVRARELFAWVAAADPTLGDVSRRLRQLR